MPAKHKRKLTDAVISKLTVPESGRPIYYDELQPGFGVRITPNGIRTFVVYRRVRGLANPRTVFLGRFPALKVGEARNLARQRIGEMASNTDPNREKREAAKRGKALGALFDEYKAARRRALRPRTLDEYQRIMDKQLTDWRERPYLDITPEMVEVRFDRLTETSGPAAANLAMRMLRAVLNFGEHPQNPVKRLSWRKRWHRIERRQTVIKPYDLPKYWTAVEALAESDGGDVHRDYLLTLVLTGLRKSEAARLRVRDVDLEARTLTVRDTKNRQPHTLPLGQYLFDLMERRLRAAPGGYVFPGAEGGKYGDPRKWTEIVTKTSGVVFTPHDLRRTFTTVAESLDISGYTLKRLINHQISADVTAGYVVLDTDRMRGPMQRVEDRLLTLAGIKPGGKVVRMHSEKPPRHRAQS